MHNTDIIESPVDLTTPDEALTRIRRSALSGDPGHESFLSLPGPTRFPHIPLAASPDFLGKSGMGLLRRRDSRAGFGSVGQVIQALQDNDVDRQTRPGAIHQRQRSPGFQGSPGSSAWAKRGYVSRAGICVKPFIARFPSLIPGQPFGAARGLTLPTQARKSGRDGVQRSIFLPYYRRRIRNRYRCPRNPWTAPSDIGPVLTGQSDRRESPIVFSIFQTGICSVGAPRCVENCTCPAGKRPRHTPPSQRFGYFNLRLLSPELYNIDTDPEGGGGPFRHRIRTSLRRSSSSAWRRWLPSFPTEVQTAWKNTQNTPGVIPTRPGAYPTPIVR